MAKSTYTVAFYSRRTGKKLALVERKFDNIYRAYDYAHYVVNGKPMTRMAKIMDSESPNYVRTVHVGPSERSLDEEWAVRYRTVKGKNIKEYNEPVTYLNGNGVGYGEYNRPTYGPLAPLYPIPKKKKTARKKKSN